MIAIILAAGRGTRMGERTETTQKAMLQVLGKNLIEWKLEALPQGVEAIILVVGYKKEQVEEYFGGSWKGVPITYVHHETLNGTGGAVALCNNYVHDKALVLMGDDIYSKEDLEKLVPHDYAMLVFDEGEKGLLKKAQVVQHDGILVGLNEGETQTGTPSSLINTGAYVLSKNYFSFPLVQVFEGEYGLPNTLAAHAHEIQVHVLKASKWVQVTSPSHLKEAEKFLSEN